MTDILLAVGIVLCMCVGALLRYGPFASQTTDRQKRLLLGWHMLLVLSNLAILYAALCIWGSAASAAYLRYGGILFSALSCLINLLVLRGWWREHLFVFGVVLNCNYLLMSVPNCVLALMPIRSEQMAMLMVTAVFGVLVLLTAYPLYKLLRATVEPFLEKQISEYWTIVWPISLAFFGMRFVSLGGEHDTGGILQLIGSMLQFGVIVLLCMNIGHGQEQYYRSRTMEKQLAEQRLHYAALKDKAENIRRMNHNFKHHIAAVRRYGEIGDKSGLLGYCDRLLESIRGDEISLYTGNAAVDGILFHYMQLARQEGIRFSMVGTIHSQGIPDTDLCVLLGNALDNALTACREVTEDRRISVISQSEENLLSVVIQNTFDGKVEKSGDILLSRKQKNRVGLGLSSMRSICDDCGGSMDIRWDEKLFTVIFMLPRGEQS